MKIQASLNLNPSEKVFPKNKRFDTFYGNTISWTKRSFEIKPIHITAYLSGIVLHTPFVWVSISEYVDNGTSKVPISEEIGVHVQVLTSKIWD